MRKTCLLVLILLTLNYFPQTTSSFNTLYFDFIKELIAFDIPPTQLDYKVNFSNIKSNESLTKQESFFTSYSNKFSKIDTTGFNQESKIQFAHALYEIQLNLERILLEKKWNETKTTPQGGLYSMSNGKGWYKYYVKHFTGVNISPEQVFDYGQTEVKLIQGRINAIKTKLGFENDNDFYAELRKEKFLLHSKKEIIDKYKQIDSTVRSNLTKLFPEKKIPVIQAMEWPAANVNTPPGIYLNKANTTFSVDVFQFNFFNKQHNIRCMDWLYMHEAIPGHHLQSLYNSENKGSEFFYFGTTEGWACYVERYGKDLGLYQNDYMYLGLLEWDLVRSARLVMEIGIHYQGWDYKKAMDYWKENIKGQDNIADREIQRITNWPGQSLCYKIGALEIERIVSKKIKAGYTLKQAHEFILQHSNFPLFALD